LADLQQTNQVLLDSGAAIQEVNIIRKHLSKIKGGQLTRLLYPAKTTSLILSDVIGNPVDLIASGPTTPDASTFSDTLAIIEKYGLQDSLSSPVLEYLKRGVQRKIPDTPKPGDRVFENSRDFIIATNRDAALGGQDQASREGLLASIMPVPFVGEACRVGKDLARELIRQKDLGVRDSCIIAGGETTVTLTRSPSSGKGGRNLELALSAVAELEGVPDVCLVTLATDGEDGLTDAAGAVVTGDSCRRARELGLDPEYFLKRHDSYNFFKALDDLMITGPTETNVNDLCFLFTW
jgi:glycerate 2-kinase